MGQTGPLDQFYTISNYNNKLYYTELKHKS